MLVLCAVASSSHASITTPMLFSLCDSSLAPRLHLRKIRYNSLITRRYAVYTTTLSPKVLFDRSDAHEIPHPVCRSLSKPFKSVIVLHTMPPTRVDVFTLLHWLTPVHAFLTPSFTFDQVHVHDKSSLITFSLPCKAHSYLFLSLTLSSKLIPLSV